VKSVHSLIALGVTATALASCAAPQRGPSNNVINRALATAPGAAQPSTIVSTEIAFARAAKELGQFAATSQFAAPGALLHARGGPVAYATLAPTLNDPATATEWGPRTVVKSCDGSLALSQGRFRDAEGLVGNYVTVWERQSDGRYKWSYDVAGRDDPQPPPRRQFEDGDIVVVAIDAVQGLVATCPRAGEAIPAPPPVPIELDGAGDAELSRDGTLRWRWEHRPDGTKYVTADYFYLGEWVTAIEESLASNP
jgi:hypothetical protein